MIDPVFSYWFWFSVINLVYLTWQDYANKTLVDDRKNWFMLGITVSLYSHVNLSLWYILGLIFTSVILFMYMNKIKALGEADTNTLSWLFLGLGFINVYYLIYFFTVLFALTLVYFIMYKLIQYKGKPQYYGVILTSFILFWLWVGLL